MNSRKIVLLHVSVLVLAFSACQQGVPQDLQQIVDSVKSEYAPDKRVAIFEVTLVMNNNTLVVTGEVDKAEAHAALIHALQVEAGDYSIDDQIVVLPGDSLGQEIFGIIKIGISNMRSKPSVRAELVNQPILGTVVRLLKYDDGYFLVQNWDGYLGWLSASSIVRVRPAAADEWRSGQRVVSTANYGSVHSAPTDEALILVDLVPGAVLKQTSSTGNWFEVVLPDNQIGYVRKNAVVDESLMRRTKAQATGVLEQAKKYHGVPYLWGGTSTKGFDCSGFTQTVYRLNNVSMPRDASQQALEGTAVELDDNFSLLLPGDLLFFGHSQGKITHVALYLGDQKYIHSSGSVHINSLDQDDELFNEYRYSTLQKARRILSN